MDYRTLVNKLEAIQRGTVAEDVAPAAAPVWAPSPEQAAWLGGANRQDPYILSRMPGNKPPISYFTDPADQKIAQGFKGLFPDVATPAPAAATNATATSDAFAKEKLAQLAALVAKLEASKGAAPQAGKPVAKESIAFKSDIAKGLVESFGYTSTEQSNEGVATAALKGASKIGARALPGVGLALGAKDAYDRYQKGDYTGAAMDAAGGVAGLIPGVGTAAQLALMGANAGRDKSRTGSFFPDDEQQVAAVNAASGQAAKPAAGVNPQVQALQQKLIAAGAQIKADGIMGPATQAAMKQFPQIKESAAEQYARLRDRLAMLETQTDEEEVDEGVFGSAMKAGARGFARGMQGLKPGNTAGIVNKASNAVGRVGNVVKANPKTAAALGIAGATGAGYLAGKPAAGQASNQAGKPQRTPAAPTAPVAGADPELLKQIQAVMAELDGNESPEVIAGLSRAQAAMSAVNGSSAAQVRTDANTAADAVAAPAGQAAKPSAPAAAVPGQKAGGGVIDTRGGIAGQNEM